jgi:predicted RNA-binding protein with TRAM domain
MRSKNERGFSFKGGGFRREERSSFIPKPGEVGKEYEVDILELNRRGEGITRIENLVIFVRSAKQGERIKVR